MVSRELFHDRHDSGRVNTIRPREPKPLSEVQLDLADMTKVKGTPGNKKFGWMLVMIDLYSRYLWIVPIKDKTAANVLGGFKVLPKPEHLTSDSGSEYKSVMGQYMRDNNIKHFTVAVNDHRSLGVVDRVIRTIRAKLREVWNDNNNFDWVSHIDDIVKKYNNSIHRTLNEKPINVFRGVKTGEHQIERDPLIKKFPNGTIVRKLLERNLFEKGGSQYSVKRFTVVGRKGFKVELDDGSLFSPRDLLISKIENDETVQSLRSRERKETHRKTRNQLLKRELGLEPDQVEEMDIKEAAPAPAVPAPRPARERRAPKRGADEGYGRGSRTPSSASGVEGAPPLRGSGQVCRF